MSSNLTEQVAHENFIKNQIDNKNLIPSLKTQIYAKGAYLDRFGDEELFIDSYNEPRSGLTIINNNPLTWTEIETPSPVPSPEPIVDSLPTTGNYDIVKFGEKYYKCSGGADINNLKSTDVVKVVINLNNTMTSSVNSTPNIIVDGREYTSGIAGTEIIFYMNRDHRISILWAPNTVENILVKANR